MRVGIAMFATAAAISPGQLARTAEELGFESLWLPEHTHIPVSEATFPDGRPLPEEYRRTLDPFVALAAAAAATTTLRIGTGICLLPLRDPITTAKAGATLDVLSGGRFELGVGAGWNRQQLRHHGVDPAMRFRLLEERIDAIRRIWTEEAAEFHGELVDFDPIWVEPKPIQRPHPPILLGGGQRVLERVIRVGDGWMPAPIAPRFLAPHIAELRELAMAARRPAPTVTAFGVGPKPDTVARYAAVGVDRVVVWVRTATRDEAQREMECLARDLLPAAVA